MKNTKIAAIGIVAVSLCVLVAMARAAQDRFTVKVPNGLAFSDFRGYEGWQLVAANEPQGNKIVAVVLANPLAIDSYKDGVPGNGKHFPDGAKIAKIHWTMKKSADAPVPTLIPNTLHDVEFMEKDSQKFKNTGGWGYAQFNYDTASGTFAPDGTGAGCGYACHTIAAAKDFVFTVYPKR